jgi:hypothetical protein
MTHHLGDKVLRHFLELRPRSVPDAIPQHPACDPTQPQRNRLDRSVFAYEQIRELAFATSAHERKDDGFFERVMAEHVVQRCDQLFQLLFVLGATGIQGHLAGRAADPVFQATDGDENAKVLLMEDLAQFG